MIEGYVGRPGAGKTYTLTERVLRVANSGRPVYVNFPVKHPNVWVYGPGDLFDLPPGLVVVDEAHLWFPARAALRLPVEWLAELSQTRKRGWDLIWSAQHESRVDRVIRDVTNWIWVCSAWLSWAGHPAFFKATAYEPEYMRVKQRAGVTTWRVYRQRVADAYDTLGRIESAEHLRSKAA